MTRTELASASDHLGRAAEHADGERAERLRSQAETMERLSEAGRGPDHGRLARHEHILRELAEDADETAAEEIEAALSDISAFRETVEGV